MTLALLVSVVFGLLLVVGGVALIRTARRSRPAQDRSGWRQVEGRIVDVELMVTGRGGNAETFYLPIVEYALPDGSTHRFRNETSTTRSAVRHRNDRPVTVLVHPDDPTRAELADTQQTWSQIVGGYTFIGVVALIFGIPLTIGSAVLWWSFVR